MENAKKEIPEPRLCDVFIANMGAEAETEAIRLVFKLRKAGIKAEKDYLGRSLKAQMKYANKINAAYVAVLGETEIENKKVKIKNMSDGTEVEVSFDDLTNFDFK